MQSHTRKPVWIPALISLGLAAAALSPASALAQAEVKIKGEISGSQLKMFFEPETLSVPSGTTVTWTNEDGSNHLVKFSDQSSPRLGHHASYSRSFSQPGTYPYQCAIHGESMSGTIVVE